MIRRIVSIMFGVASLAALIGVLRITSVFAQSESGGMVSFESGVDGEEIGTTVPGVSFSNTAGNPWIYGDVRTGQYNASYPDDCPNFGGQCAYKANENMFAWMGAVSGIGRIDFTVGDTTSFSAFFSTAEDLTIEAYDSADHVVGAQEVAANLRTGRLDEVALTASDIAYVLIKGAGNRWLMDDLSIDATIVDETPDPTSRPNHRARPAEVAVVQQVTSDSQIVPGSSLTLTVVATNHGTGWADETVITLPLDPAVFRVEEVTFSRPEAWVSELTDSAMTIKTGPLDIDGAAVTATIRLTVLSSAASGSALGAPLRFVWDDSEDGGSSSSNNLWLSVGGPAFTPTLTSSAASAGLITFSSAIFAPTEPIGLWYNTPDGRAITLDTIRAEADGTVTFVIDVSALPTGTYSVVSYGHWTEFTAVTTFIIP
ncbi:MAG: hypothetical protein HGA19_00520 [Oscillochloris sp.]|nr:hypothetical protein [Oscillochloris sp.]